jgi:hypothetical protein
MNNPNRNNQTAGWPQAERALECNAAANPVTEDELEAFRFRGTPVRRTVARAARQSVPGSDDRNVCHGMPDERIQAINEAEAKKPGSEDTTRKAPETPFPS